MDPEDLQRLGLAIGEIVEITGKRITVCKAMPAYKEQRGQSRIQIDGLARENAGAALDEIVHVRKVASRPADRVVLAPTTITPADRDLTARLYSSDLDIRITQEIVLGIGGVRALRAMNIHPKVWH
ncbi:MAG: hypothetical protein AAB262_06055, partial [Elusimicrobiota bacterium]